ncbi:MAG: alpha/beta hydrolase [Neisseriaceae bacterium]|nr:alpha/beta hydrolase [Neisseriaceae bacterium]
MYPVRYPSESLFLDVQGLKLHLRHWPRPNKPKLLLLHGWMDASASFQFLVDSLPPEWDIYALDWRGFGLSDHQAYGYYDRNHMLLDLHYVRQHLCPNDEPIHVVGHSLGGMLASMYAGALPETFKTLTVAEGFGVPNGDLNKAHIRLRHYIEEHATLQPYPAPTTLAELAQKQRQRNPLLSEDQALFVAEALAHVDADGQLVYRADKKHKHTTPTPYYYDYAKAVWRLISCPTLLLHGDTVAHNHYLNAIKDTLSERMACYPQAQIHKFSGVGHMLQWEAPQAFADALAAFLRQHETAPAATPLA